MVQIKKEFLQLLKELVEQKYIEPGLQIIYKNGNKKELKIERLTTSIINRRIQCLKFNQVIKNKKY